MSQTEQTTSVVAPMETSAPEDPIKDFTTLKPEAEAAPAESGSQGMSNYSSNVKV